MTLSEDQLSRVREIGEAFHGPLQAFKRKLTDEDRESIRETWTLYAAMMGIENEQADLAAVGALLPFIDLLEALPAEEVRHAMTLALLSHLDQLV